MGSTPAERTNIENSAVPINFGAALICREQPKSPSVILRAFALVDIFSPSAESELRPSRGTVLAETILAVNGAVVLRLEWDFGFLAAFGANYAEHLPLLAAVATASAFIATIPTTHRLIFKAAFLIKFLFARAEDKFFTAVFAHECFVFKCHQKNLLTNQKEHL